ncbi:MAG: hypothetical protein ACRBBR_09520 [Cellvibrionaceae bacterium]
MIFNKVKLIIIVFVWCFSVSCSAQKNSPADQLIAGPFEIDQEWKVIDFENPLLASPYIQHLKVLLPKDEYKRFGSDSKVPLDSSIDDRRYVQLATGKSINFEVALISDKGIEIKQTMNNIGFIDIPDNTIYYFLGYGRVNTNRYFYPENLKITAVKIKANMPVIIDYLYWYAMNYERSPNQKWTDIKPEDIVDLSN